MDSMVQRALEDNRVKHISPEFFAKVTSQLPIEHLLVGIGYITTLNGIDQAVKAERIGLNRLIIMKAIEKRYDQLKSAIQEGGVIHVFS